MNFKLNMLFILISSLSFAQGNKDYFENVQTADSLFNIKKYHEASYYFTKAFRLNNNKALTYHRYTAAQCWAMQDYTDSAFYNLFKIIKSKTSYTPDVLNSDIHFNNLKKDGRWDSLIRMSISLHPKWNPFLSRKLDSIYILDQKVRYDFITNRDKYPVNSIEYNKLLSDIRKTDSSNLLFVLEVINTYGWLGDDVVGIKGNSAIFLVIQHSDINTQEKMLPILRTAVREKKARPSDLALLEDRISVARTGKQIYGSQYYEDKTVKKLYPIIDPVNVNVRRNEMGLSTLEDYLKMIESD